MANIENTRPEKKVEQVESVQPVIGAGASAGFGAERQIHVNTPVLPRQSQERMKRTVAIDAGDSGVRAGVSEPRYLIEPGSEGAAQVLKAKLGERVFGSFEYMSTGEHEYSLEDIKAIGHEGQGVATALLKDFTRRVEPDSHVTAFVGHEETYTRVARRHGERARDEGSIVLSEDDTRHLPLSRVLLAGDIVPMGVYIEYNASNLEDPYEVTIHGIANLERAAKVREELRKADDKHLAATVAKARKVVEDGAMPPVTPEEVDRETMDETQEWVLLGINAKFVLREILTQAGKVPSDLTGTVDQVMLNYQMIRYGVPIAHALDEIDNILLTQVAKAADAVPVPPVDQIIDLLDSGDVEDVEAEARNGVVARMAAMTGGHEDPGGIDISNASVQLMLAAARDREGFAVRGQELGGAEGELAQRVLEMTDPDRFISLQEFQMQERDRDILLKAIKTGVGGRKILGTIREEEIETLDGKKIIQVPVPTIEGEFLAAVLKDIKLVMATQFVGSRGDRVLISEDSRNPFGLVWNEEIEDWSLPEDRTQSADGTVKSIRPQAPERPEAQILTFPAERIVKTEHVEDQPQDTLTMESGQFMGATYVRAIRDGETKGELVYQRQDSGYYIPELITEGEEGVANALLDSFVETVGADAPLRVDVHDEPTIQALSRAAFISDLPVYGSVLINHHDYVHKLPIGRLFLESGIPLDELWLVHNPSDPEAPFITAYGTTNPVRAAQILAQIRREELET